MNVIDNEGFEAIYNLPTNDVTIGPSITTGTFLADSTWEFSIETRQPCLFPICCTLECVRKLFGADHIQGWMAQSRTTRIGTKYESSTKKRTNRTRRGGGNDKHQEIIASGASSIQSPVDKQIIAREYILVLVRERVEG